MKTNSRIFWKKIYNTCILLRLERVVYIIEKEGNLFMNPKISVIMGIYNCADTLDEALVSLLNQTYQDFEVIMCDDGSSDNTIEIARKYVNNFPSKFFLISNDINLGLGKTLNRCLRLANGEYIARMDGDDISVENRFFIELSFLENHRDYDIVSCSMILFDETGDWAQTRKPIESPNIIDFVKHTPVHCHAPCMIRKNALINVGGYTEDKRLLRYEDCNLWYKLYAAGYRGYNLSKPLYKMRDDNNAYRRRTFESRLRAVYVQWTGFRIIHMPIKYYPYLIVEFLKSVLLAIIPSSIYNKLRKRKLDNKSD